MINRVVLIGRLTKDVEVRYTQSGVAVGTLSLAVNRPFTNASGEREADFINGVIWRKAAENFANFTHKGALVAIEGRLQTRNYEDGNGKRVYVTEVVADNFSLLEKKSDGQQSAPKSQAPDPFANQGNQNKFAGSGNTEIDISDDDLPF
ncbi:single-stranded DNA-binding protein [Leuconostoc pseudomesenteroides]|jgi:single-strand DNA-binding protein|uniref:single-stranded DNA-binding protein n=1 Tax=Leuconostoc falkenbergense TaxID=2766470 RepID=UPI000E09B1ED|nr:single-stranded DNA-binding protein [Leuconostoc falkenbergense]MDV3545884.1 single-stranded DNA-binding protein [Leuconostoc falkenbergense]RDG17925.1 single-stranded DNA-binding protein [Leuconostoc pseudomesenteroides]VTU62815.1 Single-stranded DNA-binding protein SsbA [Lactobacillus oligofermentans DSM = LMG 22743] [Leuconostoc pseudomesenteroides]